MKYFLTVLLFCALAIPSFAGSKESPVVSWTVDVRYANKENTEYLVTAEATIKSGFHIWALDAGGDGSLINTAVVTETPSISWLNEWAADRAPHKETLEFIDGPVFSFDKKVKLSRIFKVDANTKKIKGTITYQTCNESMCLPPEDVPFEVNLP